MTQREQALHEAKKHIDAELPLPATNDGKVNVAGLCRVLGLDPVKYSQHFYRFDPLRTLVNEAARAQDLDPIGARAPDADDALLSKVSEANQRASAEGRAAVEQRAAHDAVYEEVVRLREQVARLTVERDGAVARLKLFQEGGIPPAI